MVVSTYNLLHIFTALCVNLHALFTGREFRSAVINTFAHGAFQHPNVL